MARGGLDVTIIAISNRHLDIMPPRVSRSCPRNPVENDGNIARSQQSFQKNLARGDKLRTIIEITSDRIHLLPIKFHSSRYKYTPLKWKRAFRFSSHETLQCRVVTRRKDKYKSHAIPFVYLVSN